MFYHTLPKHQSGAALLAFMLILISGTSYLLVNKLNSNLIKVSASVQTRYALNDAKQALIGYAVNYPESHPGSGPGYLLCPDRNNDGETDTGACSISATSLTSVGRYPYKTLETAEYRDGHGERLWYIVSNNFRNNPKMEPLNSETSSDPSGSLTVNGIENVAAIILAPGEPQDNQSRNIGPNDYTNYIEITFNDDDRKDITIADTDRFILLTRDELMGYVEKRVLGEVKIMLSSYQANYGAYPLLTPYADPKSEFTNFRGEHNGGNDSADLVDTGVNFLDQDIQAGDIVINITDGSMGTVTTVNSTVLILGGLTFGNENNFDKDDEYAVIKLNWNNNILSGVATAASSGFTLADTAKDFRELGISPGDIIENLATGLSSMVEEVKSSTQLIVKDNATGISFNAGDNYQVRSNVGRTTGANNNAALVDTNKNFVALGVQAGDIVVNLTDNSLSRIKTVAANTLTLDRTNFGSENDFDTNDYYYFPRFNTDNNTRSGLLSFHREGKLYPSAFNIDFNISANSADVVFDTANFPGVQTAYNNFMRTYTADYVNASSVSFNLDEGICNWIAPDVAECYGLIKDYAAISGRDTASNNSATQITDSGAQFITDGVKLGDLAHNYDDETFVTSGTADATSSGTTLVDAGADFSVYEPFNYVIQNDTLESDLGQGKIQGIISEIVNDNTLVAMSYVGEGTEPIEFRPGDNYSIYDPRKDMVVRSVPGNTSVTISRLSAATPDFDAGEFYRIIPSAKATSGRIDSTSPVTCAASGDCTITDADADFRNAGVEVGDTIQNLTDSPQSFGRITAVTATTVTARLYGGSSNMFAIGNNYTIYHDYVHSRVHEIRTRFGGDINVHDNAASGIRKRDVCTGYTANCNTISAPVTFGGNGNIPLLTVRDFQLDDKTEVGRTIFTPTAASSGSLRVTNIEYYLSESGGDVPDWFLKNKWHRLVYVALSADHIPGGAGDCETSGNCLTLTGAGMPDDDKKAIVIIAGDELSTQNRATANISSYFEMENASTGDDVFQRSSISAAYNDQDKIIE